MQLHYKKIGEGAPFIILHGLFGSGDNWQSFARNLSANNFSVYLVDLRNHGHSPHADAHNYITMSEDVVALIEQQHLEQPIILGHSMGGKVAMQLAIDHPDLLSKIIVVDIAPYAYPLHHQKIIDALNAVDVQLIRTRGEAEKKLGEQIADNGTRQFLLKNLFWKADNQLAWRFNLSVIEKDIAEVGAATESETPIEVATMFVKGEQSDYIDETKFESIKKTFPRAELVVIKNAGHWVHADNPNELLKAVLEFISPKI